MAPLSTVGVAIPIPEPYGTELQRRRESFGDPLALRIPTHITLVPPTVVNAGDLPAVTEHLTQVAATVEGFRIRLRGTGTFRPVSPVVFVTVVEGISPCGLLQEKLRRAPLERELLFPYHPHVTIAHNLDEPTLDRAFKELSAFHASFQADSFSLYEHGPDGVWRPQRSFGLI
ncbi:MAG: 2'-5' RNA ligase family protein [Streptosporangiaceae bacterium]